MPGKEQIKNTRVRISKHVCLEISLQNNAVLKGAQSRLNGLKNLAKLFKFVVCNPCQFSPFLTILVPLWFIIISLVFSHLSKVLFSGFFQFKSNFVNGQNN